MNSVKPQKKLILYKRSTKDVFFLAKSSGTKIRLLAQAKINKRVYILWHKSGDKREYFAGIYMVEYVVRVIEQWRNRYLFAGTSWLLLLDDVWRMTVFRQRGKYLTGWISHDSRPGKPFALSQSVCLDVSTARTMMSLT